MRATISTGEFHVATQTHDTQNQGKNEVKEDELVLDLAEDREVDHIEGENDKENLDFNGLHSECTILVAQKEEEQQTSP